MNFRDTWETCETCGKKFVLTVEDQRRLHQLGGEDVEITECPSCRQVDMEGVKLIGRVKWYSPDKGYGFIVKADGREIFVHRSSLSGVSSLNEEQRVEFEERQTDKGPEAINVAPLEG